MDKKYIVIVTIIAILSIYAAGFSSGLYINKPQTVKVQYRDTIQIETSHVITKPAVYIRDTARIIEYKTDTVLQTPPFTACLDTVYNGDSLQQCFEFPAMTFLFNYKFKPDTVKYTIRIPEVKTQIIENTNWWKIGGGLVLGLATGYIVKDLTNGK